MLESDLLENLKDKVDGEGGEEDLAIPDHDICRALTMDFSQIYKVNSASFFLFEIKGIKMFLCSWQVCIKTFNAQVVSLITVPY